jgi:hypothetical protein
MCFSALQCAPRHPKLDWVRMYDSQAIYIYIYIYRNKHIAGVHVFSKLINSLSNILRFSRFLLILIPDVGYRF